MAEIKPFPQVKLICGIIANQERVFEKSKESLVRLFGSVDASSKGFLFEFTDYYEKQMGPGLKRAFLSFSRTISPEKISGIKIQTNGLEEKMKSEFQTERRVVNLDPGYLTSSALIMATAKDFSHRIPLQHGVYAHLELMFKKNKIEVFPWTYPDFKTDNYYPFFWEVRRIYMASKQ